MIGKILMVKKGKLCSCSTGKLCIACKNKKRVPFKPRIFVEKCKPLPVPIQITTCNKTPTTVQLLQKPRLWNFKQKPAPIETHKKRGTKICQWYRRRKALRQLTKLTKLEQKKLAALQIERAHHEREAEFLKQLKLRQKEPRYSEPKFVIERPSKQELKRLEAEQIENARRERELFRREREEARREREDARRLREAAEYEEQLRQEAVRIENARLEREAAEYKEQLKQIQRERRYVEPKLVTDPPTKYELKKLEAARIENARRERKAAQIENVRREREATRIENARRERETAQNKNSRRETKAARKEKARREKEAARIENARRKREAAEYKKQLKQKQKKKRNVEPKVLIQPSRQEGIVYKKTQKIKKKKGTEAKPCCESRYVTVRTLKAHKVPYSERFVNFCYRLCCQFYCCLSILLIITCVVIFII